MSHRVSFLTVAIETELDRTSSRIRLLRGSGTSTFLEVFERSHLNAQERFEILTAPGQTVDAETHLRGMHTLLEDARTFDASIAKYAPDTLRTDLSAGFRVIVDAAVTTLHGPGTRQLIHVSDGPYAVRGMGILPALIVEVPLTDPTNGLLAPILAHEVAHPMIGRLTEAVLPRSTDADGEGVEAPAGDDQLRQWTEELLCDAVATLISGPSMLFAMHAYMSELRWRAGSSHPPTQLRISLVLLMLTSAGWTPLLREFAPEVWEWSEEYAALRAASDDSELQSTLTRLEALLPILAATATASGVTVLSATTTQERIRTIIEHFDLALLPVEAGATQLNEWEFVLGAWLSGVRQHAGPTTVAGVMHTVHDRHLNALLLKTLELARIKNGWDSFDAPG